MDGANTIRLSAQTPAGPAAVTVDATVPATFADLFAEEHPRLVAMVLALTGDRGLAEDVAQEALARAFHRWDVVGAYDRPGAWVRRVAINLATSAGRRRRSEGRALGRLARRRPAEVTDPASAGTDDELWSHVRTLPRRQVEALVLFYVADEPVAGVAEAMGCAEGTAKAHLHQARAALARRLGHPAADPGPDVRRPSSTTGPDPEETPS